MLKLAYLALKNRLLDGDPLGLQLVDWYTQQEASPNNGQAFHTPAVLIEFLPSSWESASQRVQQSVQQIRFHLVQDRNQDLRSDDPALDANLAHLDLLDALYQRLQGWSYAYQAGGQTYQLLNSLSRTNSQPDHRPGKQRVSVLTFKTLLRDFSALPAYSQLNLGATIEAEI